MQVTKLQSGYILARNGKTRCATCGHWFKSIKTHLNAHPDHTHIQPEPKR